MVRTAFSTLAKSSLFHSEVGGANEVNGKRVLLLMHFLYQLLRVDDCDRCYVKQTTSRQEGCDLFVNLEHGMPFS